MGLFQGTMSGPTPAHGQSIGALRAGPHRRSRRSIRAHAEIEQAKRQVGFGLKAKSGVGKKYRPPKDNENMSFQITVQPSGRSFSADSSETLLAAGIRQGIGLPYGCKDGACGSCKCRKISGVPKKRRKA
jgi:ferredoxin